jgi:hypothetical protein
VILEYNGRGYSMAPDLMRTPVDEKDLATKSAKINAETKDTRGSSWPNANVSPQLWGTMLDLIYTGHRILAWQFLETVWPKNVGGKEAVVDDFIAQLKKRPYWKSIEKLGS